MVKRTSKRDYGNEKYHKRGVGPNIAFSSYVFGINHPQTGWNVDFPTDLLKDDVKLLFAAGASVLIGDLKKHRQIVVLGEPRERENPGHKIRIVEDCNPRWYSALYWEIAKMRGYYTKRSYVKKSLQRIIEGNDHQSNGKYLHDMLMRAILLDRLTQGYDSRVGESYVRKHHQPEDFRPEPTGDYWIPATRDVCAYFGIMAPRGSISNERLLENFMRLK